MAVELTADPYVQRLVAEWRTLSSDFARLLERYGAPAPALRHFGLLHWDAKRLDVAAEAFRAALALTPEDPCLWADLAGVHDGMLDLEQAETCSRRATELDPSNARYWRLLASILDRQGRANEAEPAYTRAIMLDPASGDAHFGLGMLQYNQRRLVDATASLRAAIDRGYANALGYQCLGHVLFMASDFPGCATAFEAAARFGPLEVGARRKLARARTYQTMVEGRTREALAAYPDLAGQDGEPIGDISRDAFSVFSAYGHRAAAIEIGRIRLAERPDDPIQRYLLDAVVGRPLTHAPADYVESHFDLFAPEFDHKLVNVLHYRAPERMQAMVAHHRQHCAKILDLGCGTGLAAEPLRSFGGRLTGVDLSGRMLAEATKRGLYAELIKAEAVAFLTTEPGSFDLIFAADLLVYIGDLALLLRSAAERLAPDGILALSIETAAAGDFTLLPSGRFAHSESYVRRLADARFDILETAEGMIRLEANRPVDGLYMVLERGRLAADT